MLPVLGRQGYNGFGLVIAHSLNLAHHKQSHNLVKLGLSLYLTFASQALSRKPLLEDFALTFDQVQEPKTMLSPGLTAIADEVTVQLPPISEVEILEGLRRITHLFMRMCAGAFSPLCVIVASAYLFFAPTHPLELFLNSSGTALGLGIVYLLLTYHPKAQQRAFGLAVAVNLVGLSTTLISDLLRGGQ